MISEEEFKKLYPEDLIQEAKALHKIVEDGRADDLIDAMSRACGIPKKVLLWEAKSAESVINDVLGMLRQIREAPITAAPPIALPIGALRGPKKFRSRKEKKRWAVGLQRMFADLQPPIHATLGQWKKFMEGADLPPAQVEITVNLEGVLHA